MNTKTTKFLAVLAVFAMVFCVTAVAVQTDAENTLKDRVDGTYAEVNGLYVHFDDALDATVVGNEVSFEGTVTACVGDKVVAFTNGNYAYASISGLGDIANKITRVVQTNSALATFGIAIDPTSGLFIKDKDGYNVKWTTAGQTTVTGDDCEDYIFAIPQDASTVKLQFYSGTGTFVLEKEIILDFTDVYTLIDPEADVNSQEEAAGATSNFWTYVKDTPVLTLDNYTGNTIFKLPTGTTVKLAGKNILGLKTIDGTQKEMYTPATAALAVINGEGALTITDADTTKPGSLEIDVDIGNYNLLTKPVAGIYSTTTTTLTGKGDVEVYVDAGTGVKTKFDGNTGCNYGMLAGIYAVGDFSAITFTGDLTVGMDGIITPYDKATGLTATAAGIISTSNYKIGSSINTVDVLIAAQVENPNAFGITDQNKAGNELFINGSVSAGNRAVYSGSGVTIGNAGTEEYPLYLAGHEAAIKGGAAVTFNNSYVELELLDSAGYNPGDNIRAGIQAKGALTIDATSVIKTQGYSGKSTASSIANSGILVVTDDYTQNPDATMDVNIPGFYYKGTNAVTAYDYVPTVSSYTYLDFDNKDDVYGAVTVMNESGYADKEVITELTTAKIQESFAKTVVFTAGGAITANVVVPETKTLLINVTTAITGEFTVACGDNVIGLNGFIGLMQVSKDGITISDMTAGVLIGAKGKITIAGTVAGTAAGTPSITAAASSTVTVVLEDGLTIGETTAGTSTFSLIGGTGTMTVSAKDFTVNGKAAGTNGKLILNKAALTVNGTITDAFGLIQITECNLNLASGAIVAKNNSTAFIDLQSKGSITVADGAVFAKTDKATGFIDATKNMVIEVGEASISGFNITNFKASYSAENVVAIEGTIANGNAKSDYATVALTKATLADKKVLVFNNGVFADVTSLDVNGTLTAKGVIESDSTGFVLKNGGVIDMTSASYAGTVVLGEATDTIAFDVYNGATSRNAVTGFTLKSVVKTTTEYDTKLEGNIKVADKLKENETLRVQVGAGAEIISDNGITIIKGVEITLGTGAKLDSKVTGPDNMSATFKVVAGAGAKIIGGSLTIEGAYTKSGDYKTITIPAGSDVTMSGTINTGVTVKVEAGATVTIPTGGLTVTGENAKLTVAAGAEVAGAGTLTQASDATVEISGTLSVTTSGTIDMKEGSSTIIDGYLYTYYKNGDTSYSIGTLVQSFDNKAVVKDDLSFKFGTGTPAGYTIASATLLNTNMKAVGVYSDKPTEIIVNFGDSTSATVYPSVKISETEKTITYSTTGSPVEAKNVAIGDTTTTLASLYDDGKLPTTTKADNKFLGWAISGITPLVYVTETSTLAEITNYENVTLVAMWKDLTTSTFTVTFDSNGGSAVPAQTDIAYKGTVTEPTAPTKSGYDFVGWYTDKDLTAKYNFKSLVVDDLTLYAKWTASKPTATAVDIAVSKVTGGVKVTVAGADDLVVPTGTVTVTYYYWVTIAGQKAIDDKDATAAITMSGIVNSTTVSLDKTPVYVVVSYESADGKVTATTPIIMY